MSDRAYTVSELDSLRRALHLRWLFGTTNLERPRSSRQYQQNELDAGVEALMRTHMIAGHVAADIYAADGLDPDGFRVSAEVRPATPVKLDAASEQAIYSLRTMPEAEGSSDRAKLIRACASTLELALLTALAASGRAS